MDTDKIGKFIAGRRKFCGLTQQELADELGITNKAVSKWETGQGMPDITALPLLAAILGVTTDELLSGERLENPGEPGGGKLCEVNKVIYWFRAAAFLSIFFALVGVVTPHFMIKETSVAAGLVFGCWWEVCSLAVFLALYVRMRNVINEYNKSAVLKMNPRSIRNKFLRIELWLWLLVPSGLIVQLIFLVISVRSIVLQIAAAAALTVLTGTLIWRKSLREKASGKHRASDKKASL